MLTQQLKAERAAKLKEARTIARSIKPGTPEKDAKKAERDFDILMGEIEELRDQIEDAKEDRSTYPAAHGADIEVSSHAGGHTEHTRAFSDWLRAPHSRQAQAALDAFETRAGSGLTGPAGGFLVPQIIAGPLLSRARDQNPMRGIIRVIQVATGDIKLPLSNADATSGWVGETDARTPTTEPTLVAKVPTFGVNYSYTKMTEELANDAILSVADWFVREAGAAIGENEMQAIISGDGVNKPSGMLLVPPEVGDDGARTANAYKYLPAVGTDSLTADELLTMVYDLKSAYRTNGTWLMNSATAGNVRKLKDGNGGYLWQDTLIGGQPATLSGYPVVIAEGMPDMATGAFPVAFGDFDAGYILAEIVGLTVTSADQSITEPGFDKIYTRQRVGGIPYDENAIRWLKMA